MVGKFLATELGVAAGEMRAARKIECTKIVAAQ
jgi:hypothetical protein